MLIGDRICAIREAKNLSQGDMQKRSGLLRPYLSRVENGHIVPSLETLERLARALEVPLYQLFYEREEPPELLLLAKRNTAEQISWGRSKKEIRFWNRLVRLFPRINKSDRSLFLHVARKMTRR